MRCLIRFSLRKANSREAFLALLPALAGKLLHVGHLVVLVGYLEAEDYLELLPDDHLTGRETLMKKIRKKENQTHE